MKTAGFEKKWKLICCSSHRKKASLINQTPPKISAIVQPSPIPFFKKILDSSSFKKGATDNKHNIETRVFLQIPVHLSTV